MSRLVAQFNAPPAERMAGRAQARAAARMTRATAAARGGHHTQATGEQASLDREALMDEAIHQGVIGGALREHYATCYDRDPAGTRAYLQSLGFRAQAQPAAPAAAASSDEYVQTHLSAAERGRISAAREGRSPRVISGGL